MKKINWSRWDCCLPSQRAPWSSQYYSQWPRAACWRPYSGPCCWLTWRLLPSSSLRLKDSESERWQQSVRAGGGKIILCCEQEQGLFGTIIWGSFAEMLKNIDKKDKQDWEMDVGSPNILLRFLQISALTIALFSSWQHWKTFALGKWMQIKSKEAARIPFD